MFENVHNPRLVQNKVKKHKYNFIKINFYQIFE